MKRDFVERRRHPRVAIDYKGLLETVGGDRIKLRARNISVSGMYFETERALTEFAEVTLDVALPAAGEAAPLVFRCTGIVVRVQKREVEGAPFGAAVHFTVIDDEHRAAIAAYVETVMAAGSGTGG